MAQYLRPCISLASWGPTNAGFYGPQAFPQHLNPSHHIDSRSKWTRIWIRWDVLQPHGHGTNPLTDTSPISWWPGMTPQTYIAQKIYEIAHARQHGRQIILQLHANPLWANAGVRSAAPGPPPGRFNYMAPPDLTHYAGSPAVAPGTPASPYFDIVLFLAILFNPLNPTYPGTYVEFLEVCNEPNLEFWPQYVGNVSTGAQVMHYWAAAMLGTARVATLYTGQQPYILGPGIVDSGNIGVTAIHYQTFTNRIFDVYPTYGVGIDQYMAWSVHNYGDINDPTAGGSRINAVLGILQARGWTGWPSGTAAGSYALATEGGYRLPPLPEPPVPSELSAQTSRWQTVWNHAYSPPRVGMLTNFLTWSVYNDQFNNTGFCHTWPPTAFPPVAPATQYQRPVVAQWRNWPTTAPRD